MSPPDFDLPSLPPHVPDLAAAQSFTDLYLEGGLNLRQRLGQLELQALFLLLVDTLENEDHEFTSLGLTADRDSVWIELKDGDDEMLIADETEEVGARAMAFMNELPYLNEDHGFVAYLSDHAITAANKWDVARGALGNEAASAMEAAWLRQTTPEQDGRAVPRPRM